MNTNYVICFDIETGSKNPHKTQVTQISALVLEPRKLEIIDGGVFDSEVCPIFDEAKATELGVDPVEQEALNVTHKTQAQLETARNIEAVWKDFVEFVGRYKKSRDKSSWGNPVPAGFGIKNFDTHIINKLCQQYGPYDEKYSSQKIFHPIHSFDLLDDIWRWTYDVKINNTNSISLDSVREWLGMSKEGAHNSLIDVIDCAELIKRFKMRYFDFYSKTKFQGALSGWKRPEIRVVK